MEKVNFFKRKKVLWGFALAALFGAIAFMNMGITGNAILDNEPAFNPISIIGILLIICFAIIVVYNIKN